MIAYLVNSLWTLLLAALAAWVGCRLAPNSASLRHQICVAALALGLLGPLAPGVWDWEDSLPIPAVVSDAAVAARSITPVAVPAARPNPEISMAEIGLALLGLWALRAGSLLLLLGGRLRAAARLKSESSEAGESLRELVAAWRSRLAPSRRFGLRAGPATGTPIAVGWRKPAVIFPAGLEERLPADDVGRLWLHEAAHLERYDDWTQLWAEAVSALYFFHPGAQWLVRRITAERELACDELAAALCGSATAYARTLTRAAELELSGPTPALGIGGAPGLRRRIEMLCLPVSRAGHRWAAVAPVIALAGLLAAAPKLSFGQQAPPPPPAPAAPAAPAAPQEPSPPPPPKELEIDVDVDVEPAIDPDPNPNPAVDPDPNRNPNQNPNPPAARDAEVRIQREEIRRVEREVREERREIERERAEMQREMREMQREIEANMPSPEEIRREIERSLPSKEELERIRLEARRAAQEASKIDRDELERIRREAAEAAKVASVLSGEDLARIQQEAMEAVEDAMREMRQALDAMRLDRTSPPAEQEAQPQAEPQSFDAPFSPPGYRII